MNVLTETNVRDDQRSSLNVLNDMENESLHEWEVRKILEVLIKENGLHFMKGTKARPRGASPMPGLRNARAPRDSTNRDAVPSFHSRNLRRSRYQAEPNLLPSLGIYSRSVERNLVTRASHAGISASCCAFASPN